jgi:predicted dehydrogenase
VKVLLIGAGRMGMRHLQGLDGAVSSCDVVDPNAEARSAARSTTGKTEVRTFASLESLPGDARYDAAILAATATGRRELFEEVESRDIPAILIEKPIAQSRADTRAVLERAASSRSAVWVNHYRRTLAGFEPLRQAGGPFVLAISSGAMGLGANGVHWIDFAVHLTGAKSGKLLFGEIEDTIIRSGRGPSFRDYGGRGVFAFPDGSRLMLSCAAGSSAPTMMSIVTPTGHWIVDQHDDRTFRHTRAPGVDHPTYLYGKDYDSETVQGLEAVDLPGLTRDWIVSLREKRGPPQPRAADVAVVYELLFDLFETSGETQFSFT